MRLRNGPRVGGRTAPGRAPVTPVVVPPPAPGARPRRRPAVIAAMRAAVAIRIGRDRRRSAERGGAQRRRGNRGQYELAQHGFAPLTPCDPWGVPERCRPAPLNGAREARSGAVEGHVEIMAPPARGARDRTRRSKAARRWRPSKPFLRWDRLCVREPLFQRRTGPPRWKRPNGSVHGPSPAEGQPTLEPEFAPAPGRSKTPGAG